MTLPLRDLVEFVEQKNAFALRSAGRFHDPNIFLLGILQSFELVCKYKIFVRQDISLGVERVAKWARKYVLAYCVFPYFYKFFLCFFRFLMSWSFLQSS